jgi:hypothetical protein
MKLLSPNDEFVLNTLNEVPGCLGKLEYLNGLRDEQSQIRHWGLEKIHGAEKAKMALENAYLILLRKMLETPLRELWNEIQQGCEKSGEKTGTKLQTIQLHITEHIPSAMGPAQRAHIKLVLDVLCLLADKE